MFESQRFCFFFLTQGFEKVLKLDINFDGHWMAISIDIFCNQVTFHYQPAMLWHQHVFMDDFTCT